jgi:oligopeptide/dipeptide ABC transporter ATP-binding protein
MDDAALREIRGNTISMIFQEPMQALNPVYRIGDQIAEGIILHRRRWLSRKIVLRMRAEEFRKRTLRELRQEFARRTDLPQGVDIDNPTRADLRLLIEALRSGKAEKSTLLTDLETLSAYETILGPEWTSSSIFSRSLPKGLQLRLYERDSLHAPWRAADLVQELAGLSAALGGGDSADVPWAETRVMGPYSVAVIPSGGTPQALASRLQSLLNAKDGIARAWSILGQVVDPPRVEVDRVILSVKAANRRARRGLSAGLLARLPLVRRWILHPMHTQALDEAAEVLRLLRIPDPERVVGMYPHELSGGMNQRAMIGIALSCDPLLLIADEPTTALDVTIQAQILEFLKELKARGRPSIILITHDLGVISEMCDRVYVMYAGHVIETASVREIFRQPLHPYTRGLLKAIPSHAERRERLEEIKGSVPNLIYPPSGCRFHPRCPAVLRHCGWDARDLEPALKQYAAQLDLPAGVISKFHSADPFVLAVSFADGEAGSHAMAAIRSKVEAERPSSIMLQALTKITQDGSQLVFNFMKTRRPRDLEVAPGHMVSCYLYEAAPEVT